MTSLGEDYPKQLQRVASAVALAKAEGRPEFAFYIASGEDLLKRANAANGNVIEMMRVYKELTEFSE